MTIQKSLSTKICYECGEFIYPGTPYAFKKVIPKNIFELPIGKTAEIEKDVCLKHVYTPPQKLPITLDLFPGVK